MCAVEALTNASSLVGEGTVNVDAHWGKSPEAHAIRAIDPDRSTIGFDPDHALPPSAISSTTQV